MGSLYAVSGTLRLPPRFAPGRAPVMADAPATGWHGLGSEHPLATDVGALLDALAAATEGVTHMRIERKPGALCIESVLDRDGLLAHGRAFVVLTRSCGAVGATGVLSIVGFDGPADGWQFDAATGELSVFAPKSPEAKKLVVRARRWLEQAAAGAGTPGDEAASLRALAAADPKAAVALALTLLADDDHFHARKRFVVAQAARDVLVAHAEGDDAVRATERFLHAAALLPHSGYDTWARMALTELSGSGVAPRIARELTADNFRAHTGTIHLMGVLRDRGETGDQALLEALATDPWTHFSGATLGEPLMLRIVDIAGEVIEAASARTSRG